MKILQSTSGFCMPFEEPKTGVKVALGYGQQKHPYTGESFFHHGIDFAVANYPLCAVATGIVTGVGTEADHGAYLTIRYGDYDMTYSHLSKIKVNYGHTVKAGQIVAITDDMLHVGVKMSGKEINPLDFISVLYCNFKTMENAANPLDQEHVDFGYDIHTHYDKDREEIEEYLLQYLPHYFQDIHQGHYSPSERTEMKLRDLFTFSSMKRYFYECMPSLYNPLGLGKRSVPLIEKVQNILIGDFLNYLAICHQVGLGGQFPGEKKK